MLETLWQNPFWYVGFIIGMYWAIGKVMQIGGWSNSALGEQVS